MVGFESWALICRWPQFTTVALGNDSEKNNPGTDGTARERPGEVSNHASVSPDEFPRDAGIIASPRQTHSAPETCRPK